MEAKSLKNIKVRYKDGTISEPIPLAIGAENVDMGDGSTLKSNLTNINSNLNEVNKEIKKKIYYFNSVAAMKTSSDLKNGDCVQTLGYYAVNDGGGANYLIRTKVNGDVEDNELIHFIGTNLVAEKVINNIEQIKPFKFCKALNIIKSRKLETLYSLSEIQTEINDLKKANINEVCITVEIQPSKDEQTAYESSTKTLSQLTFRMFPDSQTLKTYLDLCSNNNIKVYDIKFHSTWLKNTATDNINSKVPLHISAVNQALSTINYKFDYISVLNEWADSLSYSGVPNFLRGLKQYGKVLLSGIFNDCITDELLGIVDAYCPHLYIKASKLGANTDLEFMIEQMENSHQYKSLKDWCLRSNKPIIIGEGGCQSYWNALGRPEQWEHTDELVSNGAPQVLYIKAFINILKRWNVKYLNYWWELKGNAINTIKEYEVKNHD